MNGINPFPFVLSLSKDLLSDKKEKLYCHPGRECRGPGYMDVSALPSLVSGFRQSMPE
jgi:hypothetical protein